MKKLNGTVAWFNDSKGYGFLHTKERPGEDIFVHFTSIQGEGFKTLSELQEVNFVLHNSPKGPCALEVEKVL